MSTPPADLAAQWLDHQRAEGVTPNTVAARARPQRDRSAGHAKGCPARLWMSEP